VPSQALLPVVPTGRDYSKEKPVGEEAFQIIRTLYACDKAPLAARTEAIDDSNALWRKETVSYAAAYGGERIPAYLFLPRNVKPPYQPVLFVPGGWASVIRSSLTGVSTDTFEFLLRTGRAVLYPVYKGTFERHVDNLQSPSVYREAAIQLAKDAFRSVDYLETRSDIQLTKLGYYGMSQGGIFGPVLLALDPRIKAAVLSSASLYPEKTSPEIDTLNFAPRVRVPVLMLGGKHDFVAPPATLQEPLFRSLGTPEEDKRLLLLDAGHIPPLRDTMRETLNWFDHYLGPVTPDVIADR
jgi:cephalosporin-C deacetylase-like acetyl esterase